MNNLQEGIQPLNRSIDISLPQYGRGLDRLNKLQKLSTQHTHFRGLYALMLDTELHILAYNIIKGKNTNLTTKVNSKTLDKHSTAVIKKLIQTLEDGSFQFKPTGKISLPRKKGEIRRLCIPCLDNKIVLKVFGFILEAIYETQISNLTDEFRSKHSTHVVLKQVSHWSNVRWFIEGKIQASSNVVNHSKFEKILQKKIDDPRLFDLYWKMVQAGYIEIMNRQARKKNSLEKIPKREIFSLILTNIYLKPMDHYMEKKIKDNWKSDAINIINPNCKQVHSQKSNRCRAKRYKHNFGKEKLTERDHHQRPQLPSGVACFKGQQLYYVRYADDFLIGLKSNKKVAEELKKLLSTFLKQKLNLTLNTEKTKITEASKGAKFLTAEIAQSRVKINKTGKKAYSSSITPKVKNPKIKCQVRAPIGDVVEKLTKVGFCTLTSNGQATPQRKTAWLNLPLQDIIENYNSLHKGIINNYLFVQNRSQLNYITFILHHSCAKTIANKMKLRSRAKVFKKYGRNLKVTVGDKTVEFQFPLKRKRNTSQPSVRAQKAKTRITNDYSFYPSLNCNHLVLKKKGSVTFGKSGPVVE